MCVVFSDSFIFSQLTLLPIILRLLSLTSNMPDEGIQYIKDAEEAELCLNNMNFGVFVDLLISILTRKQKVHKAIVYYAFYHIHGKMKSKHLKQILEVKAKSPGKQTLQFRWVAT